MTWSDDNGIEKKSTEISVIKIVKINGFKKNDEKKNDLQNRRSKIVDPLDWIYGIVKEHRTDLRCRLKTRNDTNLTKRAVAPSPSCFALFTVFPVLF